MRISRADERRYSSDRTLTFMANVEFHHVNFASFGFEWRRRGERGGRRVEQRYHLRRFERLMSNERWTVRGHVRGISAMTSSNL